MFGGKGNRSVCRRIFAAVVILVAALVVCVAIDRVSKVYQQPSSQVAAKSAARLFSKNASAESFAPEYVKGLLSAYETTVPALFSEEVFSLPHARQVYASSDGGTLCFVLEESEAKVHEYISTSLREKGWQSHETGIDHKQAFTKADGILHWLFMEVWPHDKGSMVVVSTERKVQ